MERAKQSVRKCAVGLALTSLVLALSGCAGSRKGEATVPNLAETLPARVNPNSRDPEPGPQPAVQESGVPSNLDPAPMRPNMVAAYVIGEDDELDISVYGNSDLAVVQRVRPDGKIVFPLAGSVQASGLTPEELSRSLTERLETYVNHPHVTVIITEYNSKKIISVGELNSPGVLNMSSNISLLEAISLAGGLAENADLQGAVVLRNGRIVSVNFEKLLRSGDFSQNITLQPNDVILVPSADAKKIFILGEVQTPQVLTARYEISIIESISMAGGFTRDAQPKNVLLVRGGLGDPTLYSVNVDKIIKEGDVSLNASLQPGDIVFVPRSLIANISEFFARLRDILGPIVLADALAEGRIAVTP